MKKVAFYTLGCKVNQYETEAMAEKFISSKYSVVNFEDYADVYVINTCTVTNMSDRKSRQAIRKAKRINSNSIVVVVGCYAQVASKDLNKIPDVDIIIGTKGKSQIINLVDEFEKNKAKIDTVSDIKNLNEFENMQINSYEQRTRAFVKIQDGCNRFCSYCIIPYARGPIRSRNINDILNEVKRLSENGFKEVVLTGIQVASYGEDIKNTSLLDVIKKIHEIPAIKRIRLSSIEPVCITQEFVEEIKILDKLCPHYHISLQSGCDDTLNRMNRRYTTNEYREVVDRLRNNIPDVAITTDVMVGFPGETNEEFEKSLEFVKEISFSQVHVFKYSKRKGTRAAKFDNQVNPMEKERRSKVMIEAVRENQNKFYKNHIGKTMDVLLEQRIKDNDMYYEGHTKNYIRVAAPSYDDMEGKIVNIKLKELKNGFVKGEII